MRMRGSSDICNEEVVTTDETAVDLTRRDRDRREYSTQYISRDENELQENVHFTSRAHE